MGLLSLRGIESRAWRADQQDGLFDLFFAVLFLGIACSQAADALWGNDLVTMGVLVALQFGGAAGLWWARRKITRPRLGVVRFAEPRTRRARAMRVALAAGVAVTASLVVATAVSGGLWGPASRMTVSALAGALVLAPVSILAVTLEFPRLFVHAALFLAGEFGGTILDETTALLMPRALTFAAASLVSAAIGGILLARFLRRCPVRAADDPDGGGHVPS